VFNRYGQHLSTIDLLTGVQQYNFTYNVHSYFGRLLKVTDAGGQQMTIRRDYKLVARDIWVYCIYSYLFYFIHSRQFLCVVLSATVRLANDVILSSVITHFYKFIRRVSVL